MLVIFSSKPEFEAFWFRSSSADQDDTYDFNIYVYFSFISLVHLFHPKWGLLIGSCQESSWNIGKHVGRCQIWQYGKYGSHCIKKLLGTGDISILTRDVISGHLWPDFTFHIQELVPTPSQLIILIFSHLLSGFLTPLILCLFLAGKKSHLPISASFLL